MLTSDYESVRTVILRQFTDAGPTRDAIDRYFYRDRYTGSLFERLADTTEPDYFTAKDIVAVSMLSVNVPADVAVWLLLDEGREETHDLLRQIPVDLDIWDAAQHIAPNSPLWRLWLLLSGQKGIGTTICSKLLAAKRPRLVPIQDRVVNSLFEPHDDFWKGMAFALSRRKTAR